MIDLNIKWWRVAGWIALLFGIIFLAFCIAGGLKGCSDDSLTPTTAIVQDTALQGTFQTVQHTDTIKIPLIKKIFIKESVPEYIFIDKVDSVTREVIKNWDVMTRVKKEGNVLKVWTYNENDSLLKYAEYDIANDFTATSANHRLVVRYNLWGFEGFRLSGEYVNNAKWDNERAYFGLETGLNFKERIYLTISPKYNLLGKGSLLENLDLSAKLSYKF